MDMCQITGGSTGEVWEVRQEAVFLIRFRKYNIQNGWNGRLESALHGISQANMNLGVFQETKVTKGVYMQESSGYKVVAS